MGGSRASHDAFISHKVELQIVFHKFVSVKKNVCLQICADRLTVENMQALKILNLISLSIIIILH